MRALHNKYWLELRRRLLVASGFFFIVFAVFFYNSAHLFTWFVNPLLSHLSASGFLVATEITSSIFAPLGLALNAALVVSVPFFALQLWLFVAPGLTRHERFNLSWIVLFSLLLFAGGFSFCYWWVLPWMFQLFINATPASVKLLPDMVGVIHFISKMSIIFGCIFQIPLVCLVLVRLNLLTLATLKRVRPYVIVAAFTLGMILTPPDVLSQILLAVPLWFLYELGIVLATFLPSKCV
jgi:sec-independent protein translocase protein TatC